jgi:peptidoglycan/LPS O-acetylase OafA/YrhL
MFISTGILAPPLAKLQRTAAPTFYELLPCVRWRRKRALIRRVAAVANLTEAKFAASFKSYKRDNGGEGDMKASALSFRAAVIFAIVGLAWGIMMAISEDHSEMPAHAHLNLLGWVSLFLFGIFYKLHPSLDVSRAAQLQAVVWIAATAMLTLGVGLIYGGNHIGDPIAAVGAVVALADMVFFAVFVFRRPVEEAAAVARPKIVAR